MPKHTIETITDKLATQANTYYTRWKAERLDEEQVKLIVGSLTMDKRVQKSLRVFRDNLMEFLEFVRE